MGTLLTSIGIGGLIAFLVVWVIFWPFAIIWALNTLFATGIAYTFWTWLAVLVLNLTIGRNLQKSGE